jgi:hypothetical protein
MPFSEDIKLKVKKKANFTCCWCQNIQNKVEVHHIIPQAEYGPDTEENAAPLCSNCHILYGGNPELRKEIKQRRNHWYEICSKRTKFEALPTEYFDYLLDEYFKSVPRERLESLLNKHLKLTETASANEEISLEVFILYQSTLDRIPMSLHPSWSWEVIFNLVVFAFGNHPNEKYAKHFPPDFSAYKVLNLRSESWIEPPAVAEKLSTDQIALVHNSELVKFPEVDEPLKAKAFAKIIKHAMSK